MNWFKKWRCQHDPRSFVLYDDVYHVGEVYSIIRACYKCGKVFSVRAY